MKTRIAILSLLACLALALPVLAQVSSNYDLSWHVVAGGSGQMEGTDHTLRGTVGQPLVGSMLSSGHFLCSGFWCAGTTTEYRRVFLPLVVRNF